MDKLLENINAKMHSFTVATQNQLSFNKMLETQIQQISTAIPCQSNGGSSKTPIQETMRSIFTMFKENALKYTEGSLGGIDRDKKLSIAENFSMNFLKSQECHTCCDKFSSRIGDLNLQVWRWSCSQT
jgi:hypothetical protein